MRGLFLSVVPCIKHGEISLMLKAFFLLKISEYVIQNFGQLCANRLSQLFMVFIADNVLPL